ncbi:MAG: hypothetical protein DRN14_03735 [Thermoplasmata archaeon]|nr:MAG: hypothetical protein DRN14_03735 [Thermoplasmata archaeon]
MSNKPILAIDIGGTKIASGIVSFKKGGFEISDYQKIKTPKNKEKFTEAVEKIIAGGFVRDKFIKRIGIAIPGQVDPEKGKIIFAPALPFLKGCRIKKSLENKFKNLTVEIENDMNCCALAESKFGAGKKYRNILVVTVSTGIGAGIVIDDKVYHGENNIAGEIGHLVLVPDGIKCSCGNRGCFEKYVSGPALEREYLKLTGVKKTPLEIEEEFKLNKKNNPARKVVDQASRMLGIGLTSIINILNPGMIIVIGGISRMSGILDEARKEIGKNVLIPARKTKIVKSKLGDQAVLVGAAMIKY